MEVEKLCRTCKYLTNGPDEEPCKSCKCKSNWVDAKPEEFSTGDLVTIGYSRDIYIYLCYNLIIHVPADTTIDQWDGTISSSAHKYSITAGIDILKTKTNYFLKYATPALMNRVEYATVTEIMDHNATARKDNYLSNWISSKIIKKEVNNMDNKIKDLNTPRDFKAGDIVVEKKHNGCGSITNIYIYLCYNLVLRVPNYVIIRSQCGYRFSAYINELTLNHSVSAIGDRYLEFASHEFITEHDRRAKTFYVAETLNEWFSKLIKDEPYKAWTIKDPGLGYKDYGTRYDKFPTLNSNFIKKVIFSDPATIVFWEDGTKTVVKTQDGEEYDKEKGLAMAVCKKVFGNERDYYHIFKRWMRKGEERHEET